MKFLIAPQVFIECLFLMVRNAIVSVRTLRKRSTNEERTLRKHLWCLGSFDYVCLHSIGPQLSTINSPLNSSYFISDYSFVINFHLNYVSHNMYNEL